MGEIVFKDNKFEVLNIKYVQGNIHQRINQRYEILRALNFLDNHPLNNQFFMKKS